MRRATKIVAVVGLCLLAATGLWLLIAPGQLVKYPSDLDKSSLLVRPMPARSPG